ncbi:MAG: hypothetical protein LBK63_02000 [Treponema sp.]|jgi:hypothetical protein|nr:hypothetical protein [Treponema sp.]
MKFNKKHWVINVDKMTCRNSDIGIEVSFIATNSNKLFGIITNTETGLHQYVATIDCDLDSLHEQLIELARYYFAKKYYKTKNPYKHLPELPKEVPLHSGSN